MLSIGTQHTHSLLIILHPSLRQKSVRLHPTPQQDYFRNPFLECLLKAEYPFPADGALPSYVNKVIPDSKAIPREETETESLIFCNG